MTGLIEIRNLSVAYNRISVVSDVSFGVEKGVITCLIGANGAGKTTILKAIAGILKNPGGEIFFNQQRINEFSPFQRVQAGISVVPEGGRIFPFMSVKENLEIGAYVVKEKEEKHQVQKWVYELFPRLHERRKQLGSSLSGGERQMLAIGRALMARPSLLILDEPSLGLAPAFVELVFQIMHLIVAAQKTVLLVEQNVEQALNISRTGYVLETGKIVLQGTGKELMDNPEIRVAYFGV